MTNSVSFEDLCLTRQHLKAGRLEAIAAFQEARQINDRSRAHDGLATAIYAARLRCRPAFRAGDATRPCRGSSWINPG